jgi:hypothetical protein
MVIKLDSNCLFSYNTDWSVLSKEGQAIIAEGVVPVL